MLSLDNIDSYFQELSKYCKREESIVLCGGSSIVLNYQFRESTLDIDAVRLSMELKQAAKQVSLQFGYDEDFLNDDVRVTNSYSERLLEFAQLYKKFGLLTIYTITGIALLCMKLKAMRPYSNDERDIISLCTVLKATTTIDDIHTMLAYIYDSNAAISADAEMLLSTEFNSSWEAFLTDKEVLDSWAEMVKDKLVRLQDIPIEVIKSLPYSCHELGIREIDLLEITTIPNPYDPTMAINVLLKERSGTPALDALCGFH